MKVLLVLFMLLSSVAHSHEAMGSKTPTNLFGKSRYPENKGSTINCCTYIAGGDCKSVTVGLEEVEGGYRFSDGEFVPESEITLSPDGQNYRCKRVNSFAPSHCVFISKRWH